ncbi:MAG: toast rack family protein [candidate division Zixibacteria bacterium]|nr:toast rack family protein [candidate division Zixibacteria bacterium]
MKTGWLSYCVAGFVLLVGGHVFAEPAERVSEIITSEGCRRLDLQLDFSAGVIDIAPANIDGLMKLDIYYTPRLITYDIDKTTRGDRCIVTLESDRRRQGWDQDESENEWTLQLSKKYPTSLEMDVGACEGRMELGGIPLIGLTLDIGAADLEIEFSEPNPARLEELSVDCGASSLEIGGLANANVGSMEFDVGAGSCKIDLRGEIKGETQIDISVGVGSMDVILSPDVELMIEGGDNWLSSVDFHDFDLNRTRRGTWETDGFDEAKDRVIITADVAMGSVNIRSRR